MPNLVYKTFFITPNIQICSSYAATNRYKAKLNSLESPVLRGKQIRIFNWKQLKILTAEQKKRISNIIGNLRTLQLFIVTRIYLRENYYSPIPTPNRLNSVLLYSQYILIKQLDDLEEKQQP